MYHIFAHPSVNWTVSEYDDKTKSQEFTITSDGKTADVSIEFDGKTVSQLDNITVEFYENEANTPTKVKQLKVIYNKN